MASPPLSPATNNDGEVSDAIVRKPLNPTAPLFIPNTFHHYYFSPPPPIFFISNTPPPPPPPSIFVYYPLWHVNPNPNHHRFLSMQEVPQPHSQNPNQKKMFLPPTRTGKRVFGLRGRNCKKLTWRRRIHHQVESDGDNITTIMLRNIPNKYTREMMIAYLDMHCEAQNKKEGEISQYDFLYLPIDFKSKMNKGYAFVNFTTLEAVGKFKGACNHTTWTHFGSRKILEISYARIQGKDELVKHFEHMAYPVEEYSAVCFNPARNGPKYTGQTIMVGRCTHPIISV